MTTHHSHPIARLVTAGLIAGALAAPAAVARPGIDPQPSASAESAQSDAPVVRSIDEGLDWGSAAIGAAGGVGAFAIALAGTTSLRRRRVARPRSVATH
jgi:hypothetical protein